MTIASVYNMSYFFQPEGFYTLTKQWFFLSRQLVFKHLIKVKYLEENLNNNLVIVISQQLQKYYKPDTIQKASREMAGEGVIPADRGFANN